MIQARREDFNHGSDTVCQLFSLLDQEVPLMVTHTWVFFCVDYCNVLYKSSNGSRMQWHWHNSVQPCNTTHLQAQMVASGPLGSIQGAVYHIKDQHGTLFAGQIIHPLRSNKEACSRSRFLSNLILRHLREWLLDA